MMAYRQIKVNELADQLAITPANLSILKNQARAIRFGTLNKLCKILDCQPGDLLEYIPDDEDYDEEDE